MPRLLLGALLAASAGAERRSAAPGGAALAPGGAALPSASAWAAGGAGVPGLPAELAEALARREDGGAHSVSDQLAEVLGIRGGGVTDLATMEIAPELGRLWPLVQRVDFPVRVALMSWTVYDKFVRTLQKNFPEREQNRTEYLMILAGAEIQAIETLKEIIEKAEIQGNDAVAKVARKLRLDVVGRLAMQLARGVKESVDFALTVTSKTFKSAVQRGKDKAGDANRTMVRIVDGLEMPNTFEAAIEDGKRRAAKGVEAVEQGIDLAAVKGADLSRRALRLAERIDVSGELVPETQRAKMKLSLLGLVAALGHDLVFRRVQEALRPKESTGPLMSIEDFKRTQGVDNVGDLVRKLLHKYKTPKTVMSTYLALYTMFSLRNDPVYFQIAWGMRLCALAERHMAEGRGGDWALDLFSVAELIYRGTQLYLLGMEPLRNGIIPGPWDQLRLLNALLTITVY